ncbi:MAG: DMT family transporter [Clostridiales bacterium]|nr:DMT family transporter [Clostridiales bacterium]
MQKSISNRGNKKKMKKVVAFIILTAILFATMEVALKTAGADMDPFQLTFLRFFLGGVVLVPLALIESRKSGYRPNGKDLLWLLAVGIMGIPLSMQSFQIGVMNCNAATAASIICTNSLFTMLIAHLFTDEKMDRLKWISFFIGMSSLVFLIKPWDVQPGNTFLGVAALLFAAIAFGAYTVMGRRSIDHVGTFTQTSISFILGSLVLLVVILIMGRPVIAGVAENLPIVLYCGIAVTGLGYMFYFLAIKGSDASTGSIAFFIKPAIAPFFAVIFLHETIQWNTIVGIILLITASVITITDTVIKKRKAGGDR